MSDHADALEVERSAMFEAMGRALAGWAAFELQLCDIFTHCMGPSYPIGDKYAYAFDNQAAGAAFYAIESFRSKLGVMDKVLRSRFRHMREPEFLKADWKSLHTKATKQSQLRNRLAHWNVISFSKEKGGRVRLVPPIKGFEFRDNDYRLRNGYTVKAIKGFACQFDLLGERARQLSLQIARNPEFHKLFLEQAIRMEQETGSFGDGDQR